MNNGNNEKVVKRDGRRSNPTNGMLEKNAPSALTWFEECTNHYSDLLPTIQTPGGGSNSAKKWPGRSNQTI